MNWEAIGALSEIVGATAVVVTLLYLAAQIRHGTRATQTASIQAAVALDQEFLLTVGADPVMAQMWGSYLTAPEMLPDDQKAQCTFLMASVARRLEGNFFQNRLGTLTADAWRSRQKFFEGIARTPGFSEFLRTLPATFLTDEFLRYMGPLGTSKGQGE